jgi:hypothetical protein
VTLIERANAYAAAFPKFPASHFRVVQEGRGECLYATWLLGNDYRNKTKFYGAYPPGYLPRVMALYPDVVASEALLPVTLHACSGSLPVGDYTRLDLRTECEVPGSVYDAPALLEGYPKYSLILVDPPYSSADAEKYGTAMVDRRRAVAALAQVARAGGHLVWLDTVWPIHRKAEWRTVARITLVRSTNHRVRLVSIFERQAA